MLDFILIASLLAATDGKTMAVDDWQAMTVTQVAATTPSNSPLLRVATNDLDGDGKADEMIVKLTCDGDKLVAAHTIQSPRDSATGQASGKRMHKPITITKEWGPATPQLAKMRPTYDVKTMKGARTTAVDEWLPVDLHAADGLCPAAAAAIVKSKSNITNN